MQLLADEARRWLVQLFEAVGTPPPTAAIVADHLLDASVVGVPTHGVMRAPDYLDAVARGDWLPAATPIVVAERTSTVRIDGGRGFGQPAAALGVKRVVAGAARDGVALAAIGRCGHFGRIGAYVEEIARRGHLALAFCTTPPAWRGVVWHGARTPVVGTNPLAYAVPTGGEPIVADMATSATSEGTVKLARALGRQAPDDAVLDARGVVTTDPEVLYAEPRGSLLPIGGVRNGHKGSALGLLVEAVGLLPQVDGTGSGADANSLTLVAVDGGSALAAGGDELVARVHAAAPVDPAVPPRVPGAEHALRRAAATRIEVDEVTAGRLIAVSEAHGVDVPGPAAEP